MRSCRSVLADLLLFIAGLSQYPARAQELQPPAVVPAIEGVLKEFQHHALVAIGDDHNSAQEEDFYAELVRDPRFSTEVGNIVVEFGGAAHQETLDRYLRGEQVSYTDLRKVWTDVVGWIPTVTGLGYVNFFAQVREVNLGLPRDRRIHVWLGEPAIDWSRIETKADYQAILAQRDTHAAEVIQEHVLEPGKKALVIYGGLHFYNNVGLRRLVEKIYPKAFFVVALYTGYADKFCTARFEEGVAEWVAPALALPIRGTSLENKLYRSDCDVEPRTSLPFGTSTSESQRAQLSEALERMLSGVDADGLLFLGKAETLTRTPMEPSIYLDLDFRREIERRQKIAFGEPLIDSTVKENRVSPNYTRPR